MTASVVFSVVGGAHMFVAEAFVVDVAADVAGAVGGAVMIGTGIAVVVSAVVFWVTVEAGVLVVETVIVGVEVV